MAETSQVPIGPCGPLEHVASSLRHSLTADLSSAFVRGAHPDLTAAVAVAGTAAIAGAALVVVIFNLYRKDRALPDHLVISHGVLNRLHHVLLKYVILWHLGLSSHACWQSASPVAVHTLARGALKTTSHHDCDSHVLKNISHSFVCRSREALIHLPRVHHLLRYQLIGDRLLVWIWENDPIRVRETNCTAPMIDMPPDDELRRTRSPPAKLWCAGSEQACFDDGRNNSIPCCVPHMKSSDMP